MNVFVNLLLCLVNLNERIVVIQCYFFLMQIEMTLKKVEKVSFTLNS